jgi:hypothetical protein
MPLSGLAKDVTENRIRDLLNTSLKHDCYSSPFGITSSQELTALPTYESFGC